MPGTKNIGTLVGAAIRPINNIEYILWFVVDPKIAKYNLLTYTKPGKNSLF